MSAPTCTSILTFVNVDSGETTVISADVLPSSENITFDPAQLDNNCNYNVRVLASNVAGSAVSYTSISTHDIEEAVLIPEDNTFGVLIEYHAGSLAQGALLNLMFENGDGNIDFDKSVILPVVFNITQEYILPIQLFPGQYRVFFHDIEENGTLSRGSGYPAISQNITINTNLGHQPTPVGELLHLERCNFTTEFMAISVECSFSTSVTTGFQMIVLQSNLNEGYILYANQSSDDHFSASVEVMATGMYQVSVLPIVDGVGITNSSVEHTKIVIVFGSPTTAASTNHPVTIPVGAAAIGAVCGFLAVVVVVAVLLISILLLRQIRRRRKSNSYTTSQPTNSDQGQRQGHAENPNLFEERAQPNSAIELPVRRSVDRRSVDSTEDSAQSQEQDSGEMLPIFVSRHGESQQPSTFPPTLPPLYEVVTALQEEVIHEETLTAPAETTDDTDEVQYALPTKRGEVPVSDLYSTVSKPKPPVASHDNEDQEENQPPLPPPYVETEEVHVEPVQQEENDAVVEIQYALPTKHNEVAVTDEQYSTVLKPKLLLSHDKDEPPPLPPQYAGDEMEMEEVHGEPLQQEETAEVQYAPLSLPAKPSDVGVVEDHLLYTEIAGFKKLKEKGLYVFVQPNNMGMPAGDHEVSRCIHDEVIYSDVIPQDSSTKGCDDKESPPPPIPEKRSHASQDFAALYVKQSVHSLEGQTHDVEETNEETTI